MRTICIAGKNDIAVNILLYCIENYKEDRIIVICTRNDPGVNGWQKSLRWFAGKNSIDICELKDVYEIENLVFLSVEFDRILKLEKFKTDRMYNIHFSLLPKYKGCHTSVLPILHGETATGVTLHKIDRGIDTGAVIDQEKIDILPTDTSYDLYKKLIHAGTMVLIRNFKHVVSGAVNSVEQEKTESTYYPLNAIDYQNLCLDTNCTAFQVQNQVRAFSFRPYQLLKYRDYELVDCVILDKRSVLFPGTVIEETDQYIILATVDYDVKLYKDVLHELLGWIRDGENERAKAVCISHKIIEAFDEHGWTPLIVAVYSANLEMVHFLIEHHANIYTKNNNGTTLLMYAKDAGLRSGRWDIFRFLVRLGLNAEEADYSGKKIIDYLTDEEMADIPEDIIPEICGGGNRLKIYFIILCAFNALTRQGSVQHG